MNKEDKDFLILEIAKSNLIKKGGLIYSGDLKDFIDQLEEPEQEKVVIPQFVAEAIEKTKEERKNITMLNIFNEVLVSGFYTPRVDNWILDNSDLFSRAWFGYTVEQEKLYRVKVGNLYMLEDTLRHTLVEEKAHIFTSKSRADAVAMETGGTVEEVIE